MSRESKNSNGSTTNEGELVTDGGATSTANSGGDNNIVAAIVSFIIPGLGHFLAEGKKDRGISILILWIVWLVVGWGIVGFVGGSIVLGFVTLLTAGLGFILQLAVWGLVLVIDLVFHVLAAVDAYNHASYLDSATAKVDSYR